MTLLDHKPLGQVLLGRGLLQPPQLDRALHEQHVASQRKLLGEVLIDLQLCAEEHVAEALALADGIPFARITPRLADPRVVALLPREFLDANAVLPLFLVENVLTVAFAEPINIFLREQIEHRTGYRVQVVAATGRDIRSTLEAFVPGEQVFVVNDVTPLAGEALAVIDPPPVARGDSPAIEPAVLKLIDYTLRHALAEGTSEIHIEPGDREMRIRYRIDGRLCEKLRPPHRLHADLLARVKEMAGLDPAQRAVPQEGRLRMSAGSRTLTLHVNTVPARFGEKMLVRIADDDRGPLKLEKLGFSYEMLKRWRKLISLPAGLLLITGPSGSGKRTVLYSALQERNTPDANLCTIEDPIEHPLSGVNQFPIDAASGFTFPAALRAVLRQEPDVLMVSELADPDAARLCAQAALGGKLVLGAMHSADAPAALSRLIHLGVEPHLLGATVAGVLARRLVRKLCPHCREAYEPASAEKRQLDRYNANLTTLYRSKGCDRCRRTGYAGRIGIHELLVPDDAFCDRLSQGAPLAELRGLAHPTGLKPLRADGFEKLRTGLTTLDEIYRATT